jgi:hypothetical protein
VTIGNGRREALTGERAGRVLSPEIGLLLGADALRTRGRQQRGRRYGKASPHLAGRRPLACAKTLCAEPGRPCIWPGEVLPSPHGEPEGHDRDGRVQGVGQLYSTDEAFEQGSPHGTGGEGGGKGAGQGERG